MSISTSPSLGAARELAADRSWYPFDLDPPTGGMIFLKLPNENPAAQDFIDLQENAERLPRRAVSAAELWKILRQYPNQPQLRFIWHSAYCCSTAIAKALDVPGRNMSICEPFILLGIAIAKQEYDRKRRGDISWLADATFHLLDRLRQTGMSVTVKPAPASNYLVPEAARKTSGKMLFLYSDCRSFLLSTMRFGETRRHYARELFNIVKYSSKTVAAWAPDRIAALTDLEVAALAWQLQMSNMNMQIAQLGDRAASLDCDAFLASPGEVTRKIWEFFELPGSADESPVFRDPVFLTRHAKYAYLPFDLQERRNDEIELTRERKDEIERIVKVSNDLFLQAAAKLPLRNALVAIDKDYGQ